MILTMIQCPHQLWSVSFHSLPASSSSSLSPDVTLLNLLLLLFTHFTNAFTFLPVTVEHISGRANLRSVECHDMLFPSTRTQLGRRSLHVAAPTVKNALPSQLRFLSISRGQFRAGLKTHRFIQAYGHLR